MFQAGPFYRYLQIFGVLLTGALESLLAEDAHCTDLGLPKERFCGARANMEAAFQLGMGRISARIRMGNRIELPTVIELRVTGQQFCLCEEQVKELALRTAQFDHILGGTRCEDPWSVTGRQVSSCRSARVLP